MSDDEMKLNAKLALEQMFSKQKTKEHKDVHAEKNENANTLNHKVDEDDLYPKRFTFPVTKKIYKDFNDLYFMRMMKGERIKKQELFNEAIEFFINLKKTKKNKFVHNIV